MPKDTMLMNLGEASPIEMWKIGALARAVNRGVPSIRRYEREGVIDPPKWRTSGGRLQRAYTKGEFDLAVRAINAWLEEHGGGFPSPKLPRLKEIYQDMKSKGLRKDADNYFVLELPEDYQLPGGVVSGDD